MLFVPCWQLPSVAIFLLPEGLASNSLQCPHQWCLGDSPGARALHYLHLSPRSPTHTFLLTQPQYVTFGTKLCCQGPQISASLPGDSWGPALTCSPAAWARPKGRAAFPSTFLCRHGRIVFQCCLLERHCLAKAAPARICFPLGDSDLKLELIKSIAPVRNAAKQWWSEENPPSERLGFRLEALIFARVREGNRERGKKREQEKEKTKKERKHYSSMNIFLDRKKINMWLREGADPPFSKKMWGKGFYFKFKIVLCVWCLWWLLACWLLMWFEGWSWCSLFRGKFEIISCKGTDIFVYTYICTRYMFPCGLSVHLKHSFCTPNAWDSASSWKKFKERQPITQHRGGRDLAAGRCVGVIRAAINIPRTCKEPDAVAWQEGQAGAISCWIFLSEMGWAGVLLQKRPAEDCWCNSTMASGQGWG